MDVLFIVTLIVGVCNCSMFCCTLLYVHYSIAIILMGKRELVAMLNLSSWCLVMVEWLFLTVPWGCLRFVIVVFPDHSQLIFLWVLPYTGSGSETLGKKNGFRAFQRAKMSSQDTQVNTVGCIFSKNQMKYLKTLCRVAHTCIFAVQIGTGLIVIIRSLRPIAHVISTSYLFPCYKTVKIYR